MATKPKYVASTQERAEHLAKPHPCYDGQWTVHPEHTYIIRVQNWLGGGSAEVTCPGVTPETTMQAKYGR